MVSVASGWPPGPMKEYKVPVLFSLTSIWTMTVFILASFMLSRTACQVSGGQLSISVPYCMKLPERRNAPEAAKLV
jgi:hypothetical protein